MDIKCSIKDNKIRSLSEDFYSRSPGTQAMIKFYVGNTPTSKYKKEYNNIDKYYESTNEDKLIMIKFGLLSPSFVIRKNSSS